ncbi:hypothetical protein GOODEAATRI_000171 [Goodea atripinnis]|uniref:Ephrin RBD domain-containing protein n=1 Tax=Goodea atripinnis TaxID=208336 RepID=A0ABV0MZK1_9TELE
MGGRARSCGAVILLAIFCSCRGIGDKMDIVCPRADPSSGRTEEFYKVYLVTKSQMESCGVDKTDTPLLNCDKPDQDVKFTFKFQEFSPNLWGLEFLKGRDYYITYVGSGASQTEPSGPGIIVWVISGCLILLLVIAVVLVVLWRYSLLRRVPDRQQHQPPASVSFSTLAVPKRDSISSDNDGSDRSEVVFPLRPSESMICRHYGHVSGEYGPPVYIVQEVMPQTPTNVYYKV